MQYFYDDYQYDPNQIPPDINLAQIHYNSRKSGAPKMNS